MPAPRFHELDRSECNALLRRHHVGRLAFAMNDRVDIEPIHYVLDEQWLYGRTQPGTKLEVLTHNRWVAFEVDEMESPFDWRSVVVKGGFYVLRPAGSTHERELYDHGVEVLRSLVPAAFTADDPTPARAIVFRIHLDEITGRAATSA
jgi:nitroimidazol reductase NimA-like FMN-containing flavoprotein (pyridoxamine 5'-phosphate oxidase superfamily)